MKSTYQKKTGHERTRIVKKGNNILTIGRRKTAIRNLYLELAKIESQNDDVDLSKDNNYNRIKKEIKTLESRI